MYLRSLTIRGFKSFARKTAMRFEPGVTIIVGPNGSGKSNVADAVMWVLGEQSPTSLRGNRMEDVIFSGSVAARPLNIAEVVLTLDNSNNDFPLDFGEITVSRNVVRGGESEYRLNNSCCRLLDIQELLSDSGVGRTLNSVISQGHLDDVLTCRPEERREYLEEAGGLLKFRRRREKAMRRLERMDGELLRISDVVREVKRQLRPLRQQAGRLEKYQLLTRELKEWRLRLDVSHLRTMQKEWSQHEKEQERRNEELNGTASTLKEKVSEAHLLEKAEEEWWTRESDIRDKLYKLVSLDERLKATYAVWEERQGARKPPVDEGDLARLQQHHEEIERRVGELEARSTDLHSLAAEKGEEAQELGRRLGEKTREVAGLRARMEVAEAPLAQVASVAMERVEDQTRKLAQLAGEIGDAESCISKADEELKRGQEEEARVEGLILQLEQERVGLLEERVELEREQAGLVATLDLLNRLDTHDWDALNTARALLEEDPTSGGLGGLLVEGLEIKDGYETAVTTYLGPSLFGIIARDSQAVESAVEHLKQKQMGSALFLLHTGRAQRRREAVADVKPPQAVAAREVVSSPQWFEEALDELLDGVYVTDSLQHALELGEGYPWLIFLSRQGDVVSGDILARGGSDSVNPAYLELSKSRRRELERSLGVSSEKLNDLELRIRSCQERLSELRARLELLRESVGAARESRDGGARKLESLRGLGEAIRAETEHWRAQQVEARGKPIDRRELEDGLKVLTEEESAIEARLVDVKNRQADALDEARKLAIEIAALRRELQLGRKREAQLRQAIDDRGRRIAAGGSGVELDEYIPRLRDLHRRLSETVQKMRGDMLHELEKGRAQANESSSRLRDLRGEIDDLQHQHDELRERIHAEDLSRAELKVKVEQLVQRIVDQHGVSLEFALNQYPDEKPTDEMRQKVEELDSKLERIGPVNPEALTEQKALEQRYEFLLGQVEDIEESRSQLKKVIRQIDREIKRMFKETVQAVDTNFQQIFKKLFPNGKAELRLTDPDELLTSGVEIMAQPEGKRLRRISLLSGGETSLTAIAFFFALFKVRPSPFYFLDEVEAALDDVNLARFLDLVKEFRGESQLIMITHQKRSMEIADTLYGVTMHDDGISRVVSQKVAG